MSQEDDNTVETTVNGGVISNGEIETNDDSVALTPKTQTPSTLSLPPLILLESPQSTPTKEEEAEEDHEKVIALEDEEEILEKTESEIKEEDKTMDQSETENLDSPKIEEHESCCSASELDETNPPSSIKSDIENEEDKCFAATQNSDSSSEAANTSNDESTPLQSSSLPPSSSRLMRNLAEKMRRDKLNMYIAELSSLVPIVAMATKRMDKTSVLRLSANFLRIHLSLKNNKKQEALKVAPEGLESNLSATLLDALEGFMLIVTASGKIVYISDSVEKLLGHSQLDLMGQSLYTICHNGDTELLRHHLQPTEIKTEAPEPSSSTAEYVPPSPSFFGGHPEDAFSGLASGERRSFYVRLAERSMARGDPVRHVTVHLIGMLRPPVNKKDASKVMKGKKECSSTTGSSDEHLLVCVARPFRNKGITELSLMEAVQDEYVTRHLPDGRIIYSDHRIAFVAGYLTEEVMGCSAFNFICQEDLPWATVANRQMFSSVEGQGYSVYRLRSKTGTLIHLRTRGFLEFNKTTQKVETFVCINTLLTGDEGDKELEKERERITPFITFQQVTTTTTSTNASTRGSAQPALTSNGLLALEGPGTSGELIEKSEIDHSQFLSHSPSNSMCTIVELPPDGSPGAGILPDEKCTISLAKHNELELNGDSTLHHMEGMTPISSPCPTTISPGLQQAFSNSTIDHIQQKYVHVSPPYVNDILCGRSTPGDLLPRLKRTLNDVDDVVTTSAKRPTLVPSAFISSYNPIHHSPHLNNKWGTETNTTIIYDQHNNNG